MEYKKKYEEWITNRFFDLETQNELVALTDEKEIEDRFYREIKFGTGGMRALIGAGTNRINKYTVGKVTDGFSNWLQQKYDKKNFETKRSNSGFRYSF